MVNGKIKPHSNIVHIYYAANVTMKNVENVCLHLIQRFCASAAND